jgi:hypothetical protein
MSNSPGFNALLRHLPSERNRVDGDHLHDLYRAGRVSIKFSAEKGLEYIGDNAQAIYERRD